MPNYHRAFIPGGTFFFTLVTEHRSPILCEDRARTLLHNAIASCSTAHPFMLKAIVLLPDHLHMLITLPPGDADFSTRLAAIKVDFTRQYLAAGGPEQPRPASRLRERRRGLWQRSFWEHAIRDQTDYNHHLNYIHYNPVKHGLVSCPHQWPYSTFAKHAGRGVYPPDWLCRCNDRQYHLPDFGPLSPDAMEAGEAAQP